MITNAVHLSSLNYWNMNQCILGRNLKKILNKDFISKGYNFNHIAEMNIIKIANKLEISYDFYFKHNMHAVEWKLIAIINKNKSLIKELGRNWRHPLVRKFIHVPILNM